MSPRTPTVTVTGSRHVTVHTTDGVRLAEVEHLRAPVRAAGPTATAWVVPGSGHAESGATAPLVERIGRWASATIDP